MNDPETKLERREKNWVLLSQEPKNLQAEPGSLLERRWGSTVSGAAGKEVELDQIGGGYRFHIQGLQGALSSKLSTGWETPSLHVDVDRSEVQKGGVQEGGREAEGGTRGRESYFSVEETQGRCLLIT